MNKLQMAHDYAKIIIEKMISGDIDNLKPNEIASDAFDWVDAMQAEADKRNKAEAEQKRKEMREMLNAQNTFVEREGWHFDDVEEWQPDWSQAPDDAIGWMLFDGVSTWLGEHGYLIEDAPSFGFTGTHIVERQNGF